MKKKMCVEKLCVNVRQLRGRRTGADGKRANGGDNREQAAPSFQFVECNLRGQKKLLKVNYFGMG